MQVVDGQGLFTRCCDSFESLASIKRTANECSFAVESDIWEKGLELLTYPREICVNGVRLNIVGDIDGVI